MITIPNGQLQSGENNVRLAARYASLGNRLCLLRLGAVLAMARAVNNNFWALNTQLLYGCVMLNVCVIVHDGSVFVFVFVFVFSITLLRVKKV